MEENSIHGKGLSYTGSLKKDNIPNNPSTWRDIIIVTNNK